MKKKIACIMVLQAVSICLGYLFFISCLLSFLITKYLAGKASGEQGRVKSILIPLGRYQLHVHHWLISTGVIGLSMTTNVCLGTPVIFYGALGGLVFQGVYCYSDWHKILVARRHPNIEDIALLTTGYEQPDQQL